MPFRILNADRYFFQDIKDIYNDNISNRIIIHAENNNSKGDTV
jgi:hypothetical protein